MSNYSLQNEGYYAFKRAAINVVKRRWRATRRTKISGPGWAVALGSVTRGLPGKERARAFADGVVTTENLASEYKLKGGGKGT